MCSSTSSPYTCTLRRIGTWEPSSPATMYITLLFEELPGVFAELLLDFATCNSSKEHTFTQIYTPRIMPSLSSTKGSSNLTTLELVGGAAAAAGTCCAWPPAARAGSALAV